MAKNKKTTYVNSVIVAIALLIVGFLIGFGTKSLSAPQQASAQEIEKAKNEIAALYKDKAVSSCWKVNQGADLASEKYELSYRNIRINRLANRAIITDCADYDTLLVKNKSGEWVQTNVNLMLFNRANPVWQKACQIEDITVADDTVRPENEGIDQLNLEECQQLNQL